MPRSSVLFWPNTSRNLGTRGEKVSGYTELDEAIKAIHKDNRRRYGTRRQVATLAKRGHNVSRRTVRKRMVANGLKVR